MLKHLEQLYRSGLSFRTIGRIVGRSDFTVRYHLRRRVPRFKLMVSNVLLYRIARAGTEKRWKLDTWQLRRHRPKLYKRWLLRNGPDLQNPVHFGLEWRADCPKCLIHRAVFARKVGAAWQWSCSACGAENDA